MCDYQELRAAAESGDIYAINALGEWMAHHSPESWNGEYYDADGLELYPLYEYDQEYPAQLQLSGYTTSRHERNTNIQACIEAGWNG